MKKIIALITILALTTLMPLQSLASECAHSYSETYTAANCVETGHTIYSCSLCGHTYKVYDNDYTAPESFYIIAASTRTEGTLTVTVELHNNPGLAAGRLKVGYNSDTLSARSFENGEVWTEADYTSSVKLTKNPIVILTEDYTTDNLCNKNNGVYFTLVFDILDPAGDYGISFTHAKADFHSWDSAANSTVSYIPTIINLVGKGELGDHSYREETVAPTCTLDGYVGHTCVHCGDFYKDNVTEATGHSWEFSHNALEPDFENEGEALYLCRGCGITKSESIPVLEHYAKGDINGDGKISSIDSNLLKRLIVGANGTLQQYDAADLSGDSSISPADSLILLRLILGK